MKVYPRIASVILACVFALGIAPMRVLGQQQAVETLKSVEGEVATSVSHELVREFTFCELRAAWWGRYDVSVRVGKKATKDGQPRIFQITKGKFSQNADPDATVDLAKVEGRGNVVFASKEEAFARGVPFFISDATLASPTDLNYTVHSNPAVPVARAFLMLEFRKEYFSGTALEAPKPFSSKPEPQVRTHKLSSPLGPQDQNRFEIVTELENHQGCMVSNTIDLNPLLKAASSNILETSRLSHIESAPDVTSHKADAADPKQEKTWAEKLTEKVRRLKGEKVTILGTEPLQCLSAPSDGVPYLFYRYEDEKKENRLSVNKYAQHTGVILEAKLTERTTPEIVIQLDKTGEKIVTDNEHGMGFHSELDAAKGLIGRSLWPKTRFATIAVTTDPCRYSVSDERLSLKKLQKVTITRVEFGEQNNHIFIFVKTDEGREGPLYVSGGIVFDENFHGLEKYVSMGAPFSQEFFLDDPRKLHPTWSEAIWKLIEEGNVAIGMTEEMVKLACVDSMSGGKLQEEGFVISPSGNEISTTYKCSGKRFVIEKGKVTTYVYER